MFSSFMSIACQNAALCVNELITCIFFFLNTFFPKSFFFNFVKSSDFWWMVKQLDTPICMVYLLSLSFCFGLVLVQEEINAKINERMNVEVRV